MDNRSEQQQYTSSAFQVHPLNNIEIITENTIITYDIFFMSDLLMRIPNWAFGLPLPLTSHSSLVPL